MDLHPKQPQEPFEDRRKSTVDIRTLIDHELLEFGRRRDDNLKFKLDAIEKYFQLSVATRADALTIAISRIQGDTTACSARCNAQVAEFYGLIKSLELNQAKNDERFKAFIRSDLKTIKDHEEWIEEVAISIAKNRAELDSKMDSLSKDVDVKLESLGKDIRAEIVVNKTSITALEVYNKLNWRQTLIWAVAALMFFYQAGTWLKDKWFTGY